LKHKEKGSSEFIRVKIISLPGFLDKYRRKLNTTTADNEKKEGIYVYIRKEKKRDSTV